MKGVLAIAIAGVEAQLDRAARDVVRRVDVDRRGRVTITVEGDIPSRWFVFSEDRLREVHWRDDRRIPLASRLGAGEEPEILSYRPRRRLTARVAGGKSGSIIAKGYRKGRLAAAAARHRTAGRLLGDGDVRVAAMLKADEGSEHLELQDVMADPLPLGAASAAHFQRVGAAWRRFRDSGLDTDLHEHGPDAELGVLSDLAGRLRAVEAGLPPGWEAAFRRLQDGARHLPQVPRVPCHRDLHDGQILDAGDHLVIVDFDLLCLADPWLDASNLAVHLELRRLQGRADEGVEECRRGLLEGLALEDNAGSRRRRAFYEAAALLRLALVYSLRPRWTHLSAPLVRHGEDRLDKLADG